MTIRGEKCARTAAAEGSGDRWRRVSRQRAHRAIGLAIGLSAVVAAAGEVPEPDLVAVSLSITSGKTGRPEQTIRVTASGDWTFTDERTRARRDGRLADETLARLLAAVRDRPDASAAVARCEPARTTDAPERIVRVETRQAADRVTLRAGCQPAPPLARLIDLLEEIRRDPARAGNPPTTETGGSHR